ncbi:MAG TPA: site-specific integrase [Thermodesulfobacteriota bacterium]
MAVAARPLYPDEIKALLSALEGRKTRLYGWLKHITMIYLYAGLRPSETVRLTPDDINMQAGKVLVQGRTKTGYARSVDIHPDLMPYIEEVLAKTEKGKRLFRCDANSLWREIKQVMNLAGLTGVTPYSLRHSFVTYLLRGGADLRTTMDLAGHRKISTTTRYLHVVPTVDSPVHKIDFGLGTAEKPEPEKKGRKVKRTVPAKRK